MSRRNRPTALDISFGEPEDISVASTSTKTLPKPPQPQQNKRKHETSERENRISKVARLPEGLIFHIPSQVKYIHESASMRIAGEDEDDEPEAEKRVRNLYDFTIYDESHRNEIISLSLREKPDGKDRTLMAFGKVVAFVENIEDEAQEADFLEGPHAAQYVKLGPIQNVALDYTKDSAPLYIETPHSWYILQNPDSKYKKFLREFYLPHRLAQMLINSARVNPKLTPVMFENQLAETPELPDEVIRLEELKLASSLVRDVIKDACVELPDLQRVPIIRSYLTNKVFSEPTDRRKLITKGPGKRKVNIDLAVLEPENQSQTTVTPLIGALAQPYFRENLLVIGPAPSMIQEKEKKRRVQLQLDTANKRLLAVIDNCYKRSRAEWNYSKEDRLGIGSRFLKAIVIDGVTYKLGDTVIVPIGVDSEDSTTKIPSLLPLPTTAVKDKMFEDYFWFARIIYIDLEGRIHVQWFNHGSKTARGEMANPQELYLQALCGPVSFHSIAAKIEVQYLKAVAGRYPSTDNIPIGEYFCKNEYDPETASFTDIRNEFYVFNYNNKTDNCPVCDIVQEESDKQIATSVKNKTSLAFGGHEFHVHDYVLYSSCDGPGDIGQIVSFDFPRDTSSEPIMVSMKRLGRISSLKEIIPEEEMIDERELFCSENHERNYNWVNAESLIQICHVVAAEYRSIGIENWILHSPDHFYVRYCFPSLNVKTWDSKRCITHKEVTVCKQCHNSRLQESESLNTFMQQKTTLRALDVFGGCGAFGLALAEGSSSFDITHAIEIAPSAAQTYKLNSPETTVLNICVNDAVRYIIKKNSNKNNPDDTPITKATGEPVEFSLRPGDTEVLIAGFPCQPHSTQNIYQNANDIKTNLILPLLSLVDHLRQRIIVLENVTGFLSCRLMGVQNGRHHIEGGIKQGALKLLISCLNEMGYQIRFSLLQAGHYGVPQGRVRFFLVASLPGTPLPEFPQPLYAFPLEGVSPYLRINFVNGQTISPIHVLRSTLFPFVTVADAISDLRCFDWGHHGKEGRANIPMVPCQVHLRWWGLNNGENPYEHPARSRFQLQVRRNDVVTDIQHFTRKFPLKTVERVINVTSEPASDHQGLPPHLAQFQTWNPSAYFVKSSGNKSLYKRLNPDRYFMTTITNVSPTAKQSSVIHPFCRRILTVREVARSQGFPDHFVFYAIEDSVITMHRCIGNAVPWQLSLALGGEIKKALYRQYKQNQIEID